MAMASDSSLDSADMDCRHSCPTCNSRMISLSNDRHKCCVSCRSQDCYFDGKCIECSLWPTDIFGKYIKHRRWLLSKSKFKKLPKDSSVCCPMQVPNGRRSGRSEFGI